MINVEKAGSCNNNWLPYYMVMSLIFMGLYSFTAFDRVSETISILPMGIYEILIFSYCIFFLLIEKKCKIHKGAFVIFSITFLYILCSYIYAVVYMKAHLLDFMLIYKSFIYILIIVIVINKKILHKTLLLKFIKVIFWIFFIKYSITHILSSNPRPIVYVENNFELMFLCVLYLIRYNLTKKANLSYLLFLGIIVILSLSRSALLIYGLVAAYYTYNTDIKYKKLIFIIGSISFILGASILFLSRSATIEDIDRFKFALVFIKEIQNWNIFNYILGSPRITPLSDDGCNFFRAWPVLFSKSGDGTCYSVVFHSYILRVIFDHGILGFICLVYLVYKIMQISNIDRLLIWTIIGIFLINGLSVSSFNSTFFPISIIFVITTKFNDI